MVWFKKNKHKKEQIAETAQLEKQVSIEIQNHNNATDKVVAETQKIADNFNRIINENGFSLVIKIAATRKR